MCGGDALVTDIHDAFRPLMQSAGGSRQVQLGEWRGAAQAKAKNADGELAESEGGLAAFFSTFLLIHS